MSEFATESYFIYFKNVNSQTPMNRLTPYERNNVITHGLGFLISLIALPFLYFLVFKQDGIAPKIGIILFSIGLMSVYTSSTIYHYILKEKAKFMWQKIDHISIYLLIGGTYSAYILRYFNEPSGWWFMASQWSIILVGVIMKIWFWETMEKISLWFYLILGWMIVFIYSSLMQNISSEVFTMLAWGGMFYTVGTIFYAWKKFEINHAIWHVFVMLGSGFHFMGLYYSFY